MQPAPFLTAAFFFRCPAILSNKCANLRFQLFPAMRSSINPLCSLYFSSPRMYRSLHHWLLSFGEHSQDCKSPPSSSDCDQSVFNAWKASRCIPGQTGSQLAPGVQRPLSLDNARLALLICQECALDFVSCHGQFTTLLVLNAYSLAQFGLSTQFGPQRCWL